MNAELEICPKCQKEDVSPWAWLYATWPFHARCKNCRARLRAQLPDVSFMQSIPLQALPQIALIALLYFAFKLGELQGFLVGSIGVAVVVIVFLILPAYFSKLEVLPEE